MQLLWLHAFLSSNTEVVGTGRAASWLQLACELHTAGYAGPGCTAKKSLPVVSFCCCHVVCSRLWASVPP